MTKTIEEVVREKFATGYDPIELKVSTKAINEQNVNVSIEGVSYSIKGNDISFLDDKKAAEPESNASESTGESESVDGGESTEGEELTETDSSVSTESTGEGEQSPEPEGDQNAA